MPLRTEAPDKLRAWLKKIGQNQSWLAERLDVYQSAVSQWLRKVTRPEEPLRVGIHYLTDGAVKVTDWRTEKENEMVKRLQKDANKRHES
jgi:DNA-binding transcriptional regulator YdaS (Cro superfamily)